MMVFAHCVSCQRALGEREVTMFQNAPWCIRCLPPPEEPAEQDEKPTIEDLQKTAKMLDEKACRSTGMALPCPHCGETIHFRL